MMNIDLIIDNLTNPALLFFALGILAVKLKSDLAIPENSSKFISLYLLFAIGFKGGQELAHSEFSLQISGSIFLGIMLAAMIPFYVFFLVKKRLGVENAGAVAAAYGSISAVTFVTAVSFLEVLEIDFGGHMVAAMAFMEAPAIIVGVFLIKRYSNTSDSTVKTSQILHHAFTNGSVLLILGSLVIGFMASEEHARGIEPFTTDIFKGFLAVFLLDMGIQSGKKLNYFFKTGSMNLVLAIVLPLFNGILTALISSLFIESFGDRFLLSILAASASYIAVPAAMRVVAPKSNPGIYLPMALAITFPINISIGFPIYLFVLNLLS
jgi:hypothetical protein